MEVIIGTIDLTVMEVIGKFFPALYEDGKFFPALYEDGKFVPALYEDGERDEFLSFRIEMKM